MKKRILAFSLVILSVIMVLAGCSSKPLYEYDSYEKYILLGDINGIEINKSDIEDGIMDSFRNLYDVTKDNLKETTYNKDTDEIYIEKGDVVNIDYVGKKDGVAFEGGTANGSNLTIGSNTFIDGFEDGLVGYKVGDKPVLELTFPDDYHVEDLKGAAVKFEVKINSIKRIEYPEYNDENISKKTSYKSVAEFEKETRQTVLKNLIWQELYSSSKVKEYPKNELELYYEQNIQSYENMALLYQTTLSGYVAQQGMTMQQFYASMASQAQSQVKQELIVLRFIEANPEYKMDEATYNKELEALYNEYVAEQQFSGTLKEFQKQYDRKAIEITIYYDKVMDYLVTHYIEKDDVTKNGFVTDRVGIRYYVNNEFLKGWQELDIDGNGTKELYYFDADGYAPNNTKLEVVPKDGVDKKMIEFGEKGLYVGLYTGTIESSDGIKYYKDGVALTGKQELDLDTSIEGNEIYFFDTETGYMLKSGVAEINGTYYEFGVNGVMVSANGGRANGKYYDEKSKITRFFKNGKLLTGWIKYDSENNTAEPVAGISAADSTYFYCDSTTGVLAKDLRLLTVCATILTRKQAVTKVCTAEKLMRPTVQDSI